MVKNITRYYIWEEPIGIYPPRQLGASEGYNTLTKARMEFEKLKKIANIGGSFGTNLWILKATTLQKWHREGKKKRQSLPRYEGSGVF